MKLQVKVHWPMIAWGAAFGLAATITGMYVLAAVEVHGFFAEGFFLLVMGWVIIFAGVAKLISTIEKRHDDRMRDLEEKE